MRWALVVAAWLAVPASAAFPASTMERVRATKALVCGVNVEVGDYSRSDDHGARVAFDQELCRAVAVAVLGVDARVVVKEFPDDVTGMEALRMGAVDLLPTLTNDFTHATGRGIGMSGVVLWDGVGFMVPMASVVRRAEDLAGKKVCLLDGTEVEETVADWFRGKGLAYNPYPFQEEGEMEAAFVTGGCAAIAGDRTRLAATRVGFGEVAEKYRLLPGMISKDPLAAAYAQDRDGRFGEIVDWVVQVLIAGEDVGVTAASSRRTASGSAQESVTVRRLAGSTHELGQRLGLADDWAWRVVGAVGNYGEMYERTLGSGMGLERGANRLVREGGWMMGLPVK